MEVTVLLAVRLALAVMVLLLDTLGVCVEKKGERRREGATAWRQRSHRGAVLAADSRVRHAPLIGWTWMWLSTCG